MTTVSWPVNEAKRILKSLKKDQNEVLFQTGYGPSGLPHIGTFAEVARTLFVIEAIKDLDPNIKTKLVVFSDDMDGLRNLPENIPNHDVIKPYLGAPLSSIPDPYKEKESFSGYMNGKLKSFLDSFGFEYELKSSTDCYKAGVFDQGLKKIMDNYEKIHQVFTKGIAEDKRKSWSPFFPICESCGKIYTTRVTGYNQENYTVDYTCDQDSDLYKSCGSKATSLITGGKVKVGWKVDWALRWHVFNINYEMYGKDLMESVTISSRICGILGNSPPITYKYELFLDETGAKISKKIGNGISMEEWIKYAPLEVLLNFLLANPNKAKKMGLPILTRLIDEYLQTLRTQDLNEKHSSLWFIGKIQNLKEPIEKNLISEIGYSLLTNVAESLNIHDAELLFDYAMKYDAETIKHKKLYQELCQKVIVFTEDSSLKKADLEFNLDRSFVPAFKSLKELISAMNEDQIKGEEMQGELFRIAREKELDQRKWFGFLYQVILGKDQGPKMGPFFSILGTAKTLNLIDEAFDKHSLNEI